MMEDDFYHPLANVSTPSSGWTSGAWQAALSLHPNVLLALFLGPVLIVMVTRYMTGLPPKELSGQKASTVWGYPYWIPFVGHAFSFFRDPIKLMREAESQSPHGNIFSLTLGGTTLNIISDPDLIKNVMVKKESDVQFSSIAWAIVEKFFGIPKASYQKYVSVWDELNGHATLLMREPHMSNMLKATIRNLERNLQNMITFVDTEIDLQPWERWANASYISSSETEINLMSLLRDMTGHASIPATFGGAFMEKYPDILHDVYDMDNGMYFFLMGLPAWFPWPGVMKAHLARSRLWQALDDQQRNLDALADGKDVDYSWGDLDDISEMITRRHSTFKSNGFEIKERGDLAVLWALVVNAPLLVYWQVIYILSTPGLVERIREEVAPYVTVTKGESIGKISEAPKLAISHEGLTKHCPLLRSTYFEALRLRMAPWSMRKVASDVVISGKKTDNTMSFALHKGEYITMPHDLHMSDPRYFKDPEKFEPERFITRDEDGKVSTDARTIRPYGGGPSMCKGRNFAERECLSLVAGVLAYWDIGPADKKAGWVVPPLVRTSGMARPQHETRVRIKRRTFEWET
ncbi:hypothetical protein G7Y89_g3455 [Cudoniella acicularis]|uniref:Cytochrome P450 n=1 Tax=Cudoniella acicularis TaxID=354080 RepID=A0A8H4RT78_9HELO|nr:hypothetical protein G7Y89_g3455 [Cudoniella acicularis]